METTESSITNRIQEIEERISDSEYTIEKINALVKENGKSNKFSSKNIQEIWDTIKKPNNILTSINVSVKPLIALTQ